MRAPFSITAFNYSPSALFIYNFTTLRRNSQSHICNFAKKTPKASTEAAVFPRRAFFGVGFAIFFFFFEAW
jgi:hypothetical protein